MEEEMNGLVQKSLFCFSFTQTPSLSFPHTTPQSLVFFTFFFFNGVVFIYKIVLISAI